MTRAVAIALSLLLAGCSSTGDSDYAQFYRTVRQSFGHGRITKDQAAAIPYASMGYRMNDGPEQLVVLATDSNGEQLWTSAARIVIATRGGRVVRTVGLPANVSAVMAAGQELPPLAAALRAQQTYTRLEDLPEMGIYGASLNCRATYMGAQTIMILGRGISTRKIDEICNSESLNWSFTDSFWLDPDSGLTWRSIQHVSPRNGKIETEILRPPG